ncbi:MAG: hypothetical protein ABUT39_28315 [Acidobacteriota bacterium]
MNEQIRNSELLPLIRAQVKERLLSSAAFRSLPPEKRSEIAYHTVNAIHYIAGGEDGTSRPTSVTLAGDSPLTRELAQKKEDPAGDTAGQRFAQSGAVAATQGADTLAELVNKVNFPRFVAGLIDGVFNAIVTSSIQQMEAYADLVKNVSKSVDQYMKDNVSENNARDWLAERYPGHLEVDIQGEKPQLKPREGADENAMPDFAGDLGLPEPVRSIDADAVEKHLVPAARRRIAMDRQQLLATMVMMGVNRLVVTNGMIEASVLFELDTKDEVKRKSAVNTTSDWASVRASRSGAEGSKSHSSSGFLGLGDDDEKKSSWYRKSYARDTSNFKVSTTRSEDSTAKVELHAKLAGKVNVNFKSDYFPMEKMVDVMQINRIRERTGVSGQQAPAAEGQLPAAPAPAQGRRA